MYPDDTFIVSYPKSGNTWVRFLIGHLLRQDVQVNFTNIHEIIPDIYRNSSRFLRACQRPRILKSHEYFDPRYPRVIYLVRDPRDVAISYFHHCCRQHEGAGPDLHEHIEQFLAGELDRWGSWQRHVAGWLEGIRDRTSLLLVRYEELVRAPVGSLHRMAEFLGLQSDRAELERACGQSSFEAMRKLERFQAETAGTLDPVRLRQPFVRSGVAGGWRRELPAALAARISARWGPTMALLGYGEILSATELAGEEPSAPRMRGRR